jgi:CHAD domain-containing protein
MNAEPLAFRLASATDGREILSAVEERFPCRRERHPPHQASFLDTFDWRLYRAAGLLSVTQEDQAQVARWTHLNGQARHRLRLSTPPGFAWELPPGAFRDAMSPVIEMRRLLPVVDLRLEHETLSLLDREEKTVVRLRLEQASVTDSSGDATPRSLPSSLEVLPVRGYDEEFRGLVSFLQERQQLEEKTTSRLEEALAALGRYPGDYSSKPGLELEPTQRTDVAMREILNSLWRVIKANEQGVRHDLDSEFLHDFRVATRRTRSALTQIKGVFPAAAVARFRQEFAWLGQITGPTRDLDVYLLKMPSYRASLPESIQHDLEPLAEFLRRHQRLEHQRLVQGLDSERFATLSTAWTHFLKQSVAADSALPGASTPVLETATHRIWKAYRRVLKKGSRIGPESPPQSLHRLRIDCKKLRYLLEFFRSLFDEAEVARLISILKRLQDNLGDYNDLEVQQEALQHYAHEMFQEGLATVETLMALGRLIDRLGARQAKERQRFHKRFETFSARRNRRRFRSLFKPADTVAT